MGDARGVRVQLQRAYALAVILALASGACRDIGEPSPGAVVPALLEPNVIRQGSVQQRDTARFYVRSEAGVPFTVALTALRDAVTLLVRDSTGNVLARTHATVFPADSASVTTPPIERDVAARYDVLVIGSGRFTVRLY